MQFSGKKKKSRTGFPNPVTYFLFIGIAVAIGALAPFLAGWGGGGGGGRAPPPPPPRFLSLVPRPHPRGGKGSGELGQNPWACAEEFPRANEIVVLAQSYDKLTAVMQHRYTVCIAIQFRRPIRFKVCFTAGCGHAITCAMQTQP